jgi:hypothetical protein
MRQSAIAIVIAVALVLAGCKGPLSPVEQIRTGPFQTDRASYTAVPVSTQQGWTTYGFDVVTSLSNVTQDTLFLQRCMPSDTHPMYDVIQVAPAGADPGYSPAWGCVGGVPPIAVLPGEVREDSLRLTGPTSFDETTGKPIGTTTGTYAIRFDVSGCSQQAPCAIGDSLSTSTTFTVTHD